MSWTGNLTAIINNVDLFEGEDGALEAIYTPGAMLSISMGRPIDKNGMMSWLFMMILDGKATKGILGRQHHQFLGCRGGMMHSTINGAISGLVEGDAMVDASDKRTPSHNHIPTHKEARRHKQSQPHTETCHMHADTRTQL